MAWRNADIMRNRYVFLSSCVLASTRKSRKEHSTQKTTGSTKHCQLLVDPMGGTPRTRLIVINGSVGSCAISDSGRPFAQRNKQRPELHSYPYWVGQELLDALCNTALEGNKRSARYNTLRNKLVLWM